jgi:hypothetical protein
MDAAHVVALGMFGSLVIGTAAVLWAAPWSRRWAALVAALVTIAASLPGWRTTPDGILQDTYEYAHWALVQQGWMLFHGHNLAHGVSWQLYLVAIGHQWTGTWLVERALGLVWHCLFVAAVCALPGVPLRALPIVIAIVSCTPFGLWLQRHHMGSELLLAQVLLVHALITDRRVLAGWWLAIAHCGYMGAFATLAYPIVWLGRRAWKTYLVAGLLFAPALCTGWLGPAGYKPGYVLPPLTLRLLNAFRSLWDARYSADLAWLWSYPGAQTLPVVACVAVGLGVAWSLDWRWTIALVAGAMPSVLGGTLNAPSHRQMFMLLPLAVIAAHCPARLTLAVAIAVMGLLAWHDPAFWVPWQRAGIHHF